MIRVRMDEVARLIDQLAWYALLARAAGDNWSEVRWSRKGGYICIGGAERLPCEFDENGLPVRTEEREAAIREALGETK